MQKSHLLSYPTWLFLSSIGRLIYLYWMLMDIFEFISKFIFYAFYLIHFAHCFWFFSSNLLCTSFFSSLSWLFLHYGIMFLFSEAIFSLLALCEIFLYSLLSTYLPLREWLIKIKAFFPGSWASGSLKPSS